MPAGAAAQSAPAKKPSPVAKPPAAKRAATKASATKPSAPAEAAASTPAASTKGNATKQPAATKKGNGRASASGASFVEGDAPAEGVVLITGICGRLGKLLARTLHRETQVEGVDRRPFPDCPKDIVHHPFDLRRKKVRDVFRGGRIRAVVHLGALHDPRKSLKERHNWNVVAFQKLLDYVEQYEVPKLVVLSSANVYGPQPDNPQFLTEESPLLGSRAFGGIRDLVEMEMLAQSFFWRRPSTETVVLRPVHILGRVHNAASNYLRLERPMTIFGFDPMVQVIHERDVVDAIRLALAPGVSGIFNIKGRGELPLSRILRKLGRRPRPVPGPLATAALDRLWRYRLTSFPTPELDHIRYICMVDDSRAREVLGFRPSRSLEETIHAPMALR